MAEHRRIEPRTIVGTGMATDPERLRDIDETYERRRRAWRHAPAQGFGDVLSQAPPRGSLAGEGGEDSRRRRKGTDAAGSDALDAEGGGASSAQPTSEGPSDGLRVADPSEPGKQAGASPSVPPRVPPDPREAELRRRLAQAGAVDKRRDPTKTRTGGG